MASFSACREDHFQKKLSKTDLPFRFCKIGLRNTLFIFGRKNCRCVLFRLLQICPILAYFVVIEALIELRKMLLRKKLFDVRLGNYPTPKVLIYILQICKDASAIDLLDGRSVLNKLFFQNKVRRVLYKLVLVTFTAFQTSGLFKKQKIKCVPIIKYKNN